MITKQHYYGIDGTFSFEIPFAKPSAASACHNGDVGSIDNDGTLED